MNPRAFAASFLLFGSGLCALVYQTVWLREFRLIFGASTASTAAVLGIFMGGLGVGSVLLGRRAEQSKRPLAFYANLEFAIALAAAITPFLVTLVRHLYSALGGSLTLGPILGTVVRLALAALVLAGPTLLMGGTLPAVARSVVGHEDAGRRSLAWLYGINTLGAVTGALLSTFVALEFLGNRHTLWAACLLNALVALAARLLARTMPAPDDAPAVADPSGEAAAPPRFVLFAAALVGFAFLLMELVWYRMLSPLLGGSTFTFGLILAVALFGIGVGGALYALFGQRTGGTLTAFSWTCALEALTLAIPFALGDRLAVLAAHLRSLSTVGFSAHIFGWSVVIAIVVLPAAIVAGFQFPLLVALLGRGGQSVASHTARTYALNTAGAIVGSLAGGFGLMPLFTAPGLWKMVVVLLAGLAIAALLIQRRRGSVALLPAGGVCTAVFLAAGCLLALGPTSAWRHSGVGVGRSAFSTDSHNHLLARMAQFRRMTIWEGDGVESSVGILAINGLSFIVNGKSDGNIRGDAGTQVMGGLIGAALKSDVRKACVIGLGTGSTSGWLGQVPEIERVDTMELEPAITHMARLCEVANQHVLDNPKCHLLFGDAREMLITTRERYDLIFSEPSNPYRAGIASLFTTEFYQIARERLNPGGLFLQWVQAYEVDGEAIRMVLATLGGVFPNVEIWATQTGDMLLVASVEPRVINVDALRARLQTEPFRTATRRIWGVDNAEGFLAHYLAGPELPRQLAAMPGVSRNTDDNTLLEFAFARSTGRSGGFQTNEFMAVAKNLNVSRPAVVGEVDWTEVGEQTIARMVADGIPSPPIASLPEAWRARCELRSLAKQERWADAGQLWLQKKPAPLNPHDVTIIALALATLGSEEAAPFIERMKADQPAEAATILAMLRVQQNRFDEVAEPLLAAFAAYRTDPWPRDEVLSKAFMLTKMADFRPGLAAPFLQSLQAGPLPGYLMEAMRRETLVRLTMTNWKARQPVSGAVFAVSEPWPEWTRDALQTRYEFYKQSGFGDAAQAQADLARFLAAETVPFNRGFQPRPATAATR